MSNVEPFEIIAVPFDAYIGPAGTDKPDIGSAVGGPYTLLGSRGADEYDEAGVTVTHEQSITEYRGLRGTGPIKVFRTSEGLKIAFELNDLTLESYALAVNKLAADVEDVGSRALQLHQGAQVQTLALVLRSADGPYGDNMPAQYWVPVVYQSGSPAVVHKKGDPAGLALEFTAIEWLDAAEEGLRFGILEAQDAAGS